MNRAPTFGRPAAAAMALRQGRLYEPSVRTNHPAGSESPPYPMPLGQHAVLPPPQCKSAFPNRQPLTASR